MQALPQSKKESKKGKKELKLNVNFYLSLLFEHFRPQLLYCNQFK